MSACFSVPPAHAHCMPSRYGSPARFSLFPFELRVRSADIALMKLVDEQPVVGVFAADRLDRFGNWHLRDEDGPYVAKKSFQIMLLGRDCGGPCAGTAVARNGSLRTDSLELVNRGDETAKIAVDDRNMVDKPQIAQKKRLARLVENREVGVGMRGLPRAQAQAPAAQVQPLDARDRMRRQHDRTPLRHRAEIAHQRAEIIWSAPPHRLRQSGMTDELRPIIDKRLVAEDVIGMNVRIDHIANR